MNTGGGSSPRQHKASIGPRARRKHRRKGSSRTSRQNQPIEVPRLPQSPAPKAVAPYTPRSEIEDSNLRFLIYHYVTVVTATTVTNVGPRFEWYPLAVRDEAFFHVLISSTSSHAAYLQKVEPLPRTFYLHRGEAIRLLNERLAKGAHDEGTINTVCMFSQQDSFEGRPEKTKTHLNGLLQLVQAAGGLHSTELTAKSRRHLYLTDLSAAIALDSKPVFPFTLVSGLETYFAPPSSFTAGYMKTFETRLFNFSNSPLSICAANVLWGLRNVTLILDAIHAGTETADTPSAEDLQFTDRVEVLERLVHQLWYVEDPEEPQHHIFRTFGWACLIHIYCKLRELPPELGMNAMLAGRIRSALESCHDLNVLLATFQDLFLWQMFVVGRVADARDRAFFAQQATKILLIRKIDNQEEILGAADGFLWPEREVATPVQAAFVEDVTDLIMSDVDELETSLGSSNSTEPP